MTEKSKNTKVHYETRIKHKIITSFFTKEVSALFTQDTERINDDVEAAVKVFNSAVKLAGDCMKRTVTSGNISGKPWFDLECTKKRSCRP